MSRRADGCQVQPARMGLLEAVRIAEGRHYQPEVGLIARHPLRRRAERLHLQVGGHLREPLLQGLQRVGELRHWEVRVGHQDQGGLQPLADARGLGLQRAGVGGISAKGA